MFSRWNRFRTFCACDKKLKLALELTEDLPSEQEINRWLGEPIGCVIIKPKTFLTNQSGYPVLSKAHQRIVNELMSRQIEFLISGACREDMRPLYAQYLQHLMQVYINQRLRLTISRYTNSGTNVQFEPRVERVFLIAPRILFYFRTIFVFII